MARRGNGQKRVKIEKMQEASVHHVTFSRRRLGLFKTGSDLCTLCGAEVAILVFSPGGKVFTFGHPCLESVIERYFNQEPPPDDKTQEIALAQRKSSQLDLNNRVTELERLIEEEKRISEAIHHQITKERAEDPKWWEQPFEVLNLAQLAALKGHLGILRDNVMRKPHLLDACVPSNPIANRLNPLNMTEHGFCGRNGTPSFLSANRVPINTRAPGFNGTAPYDPMKSGSTHWGPVDTPPPANVSNDPMAAGSNHRGSTDTRAPASVTYNPMAAGSSHGMPIYIQTPGFRGNAPYDPIAVGSSQWVPMTHGHLG